MNAWRRWYYERGGREKERARQRAIHGYRPIREYDCIDCGQRVRGYVDDRCTPCRTLRRRHEARPPARRLHCVRCRAIVLLPRRMLGTNGGVARIACSSCRRELAAATNRRKNAKRRGARGLGRYTLADIGARDQWRCHICRRPVDRMVRSPKAASASIDHLIPIADGGSDTPENVTLAHRSCNSRRGRRGPAQLRWIA